LNGNRGGQGLDRLLARPEGFAIPFSTQRDSEHLVEFYETREFLAETVTGFIGAALRDGNAAIVMATTAHRDAIDASLRAAQVDLAAAAAADRYVSVDATALLDGFMAGGAPGAALFGESIGRAIARAGAGGRSVRIFDEVVALLWDRADVTSAVTLENLWDELAAAHEFELLCAYPMRVFEDSANAEAFQRIRARHTTAVPSQNGVAPHQAEDEQRAVEIHQHPVALYRDPAGGSATGGVQPRDPADQLALSDHAERVGGIGSWDWTPHTGELHWSDHLFRIAGLEPGSVTLSPELVLSLVHPADIGRVKEVLGVLRAGGGMRMLECRIVRHDDVVADLRVTVALSMGGGEQEHFVGCVQDVTAERRMTRTLAAHVAVATALDEWQTFEPGVGALLEGLASAMDLCYGVLWLPRGAGLTAKLIWHVDSAPLVDLAATTRTWRAGEGAPWLGWSQDGRQPVVSNQPVSSAVGECAEAMRAAAIKTALAIPAVAVDETLAVLEFFSFERVEPSGRLLRSLKGIGHEIGWFLDRRRGELVAPVLTPRGVQVLQLAAHALSSADIARELHVSSATVKRHFEDSYARLGVSDRASAVAKAMRQGLID